MKKSCFRAFIILQVILISFLFLSLTLIIQILLDSRFDLYKTNEKTEIFFNNTNFLDEILRKEFKNLEYKINNREVKNVEELLHENNNGEKIYLISTNDKTSKGGYTILVDNDDNKDLDKKLKRTFKSTFNIHYKKKIKIAEKIYSIQATIEYKIGKKKSLENLNNAQLIRMWIIENV